MKKYLFILSMLVLGLSSCTKDKTVATVDPAVQAKIDDDAIKAYLVAHPDITAIKDPSGLYYQVITEGTGASITTASTVKVSYVGTTLQGAQFDANENYTTALTPTTNIIEGWKIGVPKAKVGGKILLILPSALAYGPYGNGPIAPNTIIKFTITVKELVNTNPNQPI
jgi:FKBP-type peptidyl-prolyl cis-trans isomerase FkpA